MIRTLLTRALMASSATFFPVFKTQEKHLRLKRSSHKTFLIEKFVIETIN